MRKLQSIAMFLLTLCLCFSVASCSSDDDNKTNGISKEDVMGFWKVDTDHSQIVSATVNGTEISVEDLKDQYGDYSPVGLLFLNENGTASFEEKESLWKVEDNGFKLYTVGDDGTDYKVSNLSYDNMTIDYVKTINDSDDELALTCHATLSRYSLESTSKDNNLLVGSWKAKTVATINDVTYTTEYYYDFYANGSFKFKLSLVGMFETTQFGLYSFDKSKNILTTNNTNISAVLDGNKLTVLNEDEEIIYEKQ